MNVNADLFDGYNLSDDVLQKELDNTNFLSSAICDTPIALISFFFEEKIVIKATNGIDCKEIFLGASLSKYLLAQNEALIINDLTEDERFSSDSAVVNGRLIKFFANVPLTTPQGKIIGALTVMDTSPKELSKEKLKALAILSDKVITKLELQKKQKESDSDKQLFAKFLEAIPLAVAIIEKDLNLYYANKKCDQLLGKSIGSKLVPNEINDTYNLRLSEEAEFNEEERSLLSRALKGETCYSNNYEVHHSGKIIPVQIWCSPIYSTSNELTHVICILDEVTKQKHIEKQLKESEENYRNLIEDVGDVVYTADPYGNFTFINNRVIKLVEYTPEELLGKHFTTLIAPDWKEKIKEYYFIQFKQRREETVLEFPVKTKSGNIRWVEQSVRVWWSPDGKIRSFHCMVRDIDARKQVELALIEAKHVAEEAKKLQEVFLANMSHEIRTPINGVLGVANLLANTSLSEKQQEYVNATQLSGNNLMVIINDILDLTKIQAGKISFESIDFDLQETLQNVVYPIKRRAEEKGIDFLLEIDQRINNNLIGDPTRLAQIMTNLVGNSVKFTEKGFVKVFVSLANDSLNRVQLEFIIEDTGIGTPQEKINNIFEKFTQANTNTTRKFGGTGLGLSISKQLIDLQGGSINVKSEEGKGSVFTFHLSFEKSALITKSKVEIPAKKKSLEGIRILVAEDNLINQMVASDTLTNWNADVEVAENGKEVLTKIEESDFDLILMDLQMPEMGGEECTKIIRETKSSISEIPIIAMTASAFKKEKEKCFNIGMNGYVSKPFYAEDLFNEIVSVLKG